MGRHIDTRFLVSLDKFQAQEQSILILDATEVVELEDNAKAVNQVGRVVVIVGGRKAEVEV